MRPVPLWEKGIAGFALALSTFALFPLLHSGAGGVADPTRGDPVSSKLWLVVYAATAFLFLRRSPDVLAVVARNRLLFSLVALAVVSTAWSATPALTLHRAVSLVLLTLLGVYVAATFSRAEVGSLVAWVLAGIVLASFAFAILRPAYGLDHVRGNAWRGVFTTKNELGRIAALTGALWLLRALTLRGHPVVALVVVGASGFALHRSASKTALVVVLLLIVYFVVLPALRAHSSIAIPAGAFLVGTTILGASWLVGHSDAVLSSLGADPTFTGRSEIWSAVWHMISLHPWHGYGYGAFWRGVEGPSAYVWAVVQSTPPHSHNAFLDVWLDVGVFGVVLLAGALVVNVARAAARARQSWSFEDLAPLTILFFLVLFSISESTLVPRASFFWLLFVVTSVQLGVREPAFEEAAEPALAAESLALRELPAVD